MLVADDTDGDDSSSLRVTQIRKAGNLGFSVTSGTTYANGTSYPGTYGTITVGADGSYTYTANTAAAEALDAGDTATESFTYTVYDGYASDLSLIHI